MDINYKLVLDSTEWTQSVQSALTQLNQINAELNKTKSTASNAFAQSALDTDKLANKMEEIVKINGEMLIEFQKLGTAIKSATSTSEIKQLNDEIAKLKKQIDALSSTVGGGGGLGATMGKLKNQLYQLRVEGKENTDQYRQLNAQLATMQANMSAVDRAAKQYQTTNKQLISSVNDTGQVAALAGANVISFGQVLSDLPYGIRGIANNLQQMTATMVTLIVQAGSATKAMAALRSAFVGPLGIIVVIQGALAALDWYSGGMEKAKKTTDEASVSVKEFSDKIQEQEIRLRSLAAIQNETSESQEKRNLANKELVEILGDEAKNTAEVNSLITKYIRLQRLKAEVDTLVLEISKMQKELTDAEFLNKDAEAKYLKESIEAETIQLGIYMQEILVLDKLFEKEKKRKKEKEPKKEKEKSWKVEETFAEEWEKLQREQYELGIQLEKESAIKRKSVVDQNFLDGLLTQEEYNKNIENLEAEKLQNLLYLSQAYNMNVIEAENATMEQRVKMYGDALKEAERLRKEAEEAAEKNKKGAIAKFLGVEDKDVEIILRNIRIIGKELSNIFNEFNEAAQRNNKEVIKSLDDVIAKTEEKIDAETELQQMGLANNLEGEREYLAQQTALREEAFERQKRLELQKLAIDSISQLSSLITASAQIWQTTSKVPQPFGSALAIAAIAAMFGSFAVSKTKAVQMVKSQESFEEGGVVQGKRHTQGGEKFYSSDGNHMVEIEQGEYVTNRESTSKYMDLLHAINNDEIGSHNIHKLLEGTGVTLPTVDTEMFRRDLKRATVGSLNESTQSETKQTDMSADLKDIKRYVKDIAEKETIITDGNKTVVKQGSKTIITRRGN